MVTQSTTETCIGKAFEDANVVIVENDVKRCRRSTFTAEKKKQLKKCVDRSRIRRSKVGRIMTVENSDEFPFFLRDQRSISFNFTAWDRSL